MPSFEQKPSGTIALLDVVCEMLGERYRPLLLNQTATVDCGDAIQEGLNRCAAGRVKGLYLHRRCVFPTTKQIVLEGTTYDGVYLCGPPLPGYDESAPRIQALNNITPSATRGDAMLWVNGVSRFGMHNVSLHMADYTGDHMWLAYASYGPHITNATFGANEGVICPTTEVDSVNFAGTGVINIGLNSSKFNVGDRVQVWKRSDAVIPNELSDGMVLYVRSRSGANLTFSTTLGGSLLTYTGTESGIWGFQRNHWTVASIAGATVTIPNHGWQNNQKVQFSNRSLLTAPESTPRVSYPSLPLYVKNATTNTVQLSLTPGGATVSLSGHVAGQTLSRVRFGILGGGLQYGGIYNAKFHRTGASIALSQYYAPGGIYVGWDSFTWSNILCNDSPLAISGRGNVNGLRLEGKVQGGFESMLGLGSDGSIIDIADLYTEIHGGPVKAAAVSVFHCYGRITGHINGPASYDTDSIAVVHHSPGYRSRMRIDCKIDSWNRPVVSTTAAGVQPYATSVRPFRSGASDTQNCVQPSYYWDKAIRPTTGDLELDLHNTDVSREYDGREFGETPYWTHRESAANPAALNTRYGVIHELSAALPHTVADITDKVSANPGLGPFGFHGAVVARSALSTLGAAAFETLSGADFKLPANVPYGLIASQDGNKLRLMQPLGSTVQSINPAAQTGNYAATAIFSAAPLAGQYTIEGTLTMGTPSSAGTYVVTLSYNDGTARTVDLVAMIGATPTNSFSATAAQVLRFLVTPFVVASGNPTLAVTFTGLGTAPSYTIDLVVRRIR
jgi:hypothetical protein